MATGGEDAEGHPEASSQEGAVPLGGVHPALCLASLAPQLRPPPALTPLPSSPPLLRVFPFCGTIAPASPFTEEKTALAEGSVAGPQRMRSLRLVRTAPRSQAVVSDLSSFHLRFLTWAKGAEDLACRAVVGGEIKYVTPMAHSRTSASHHPQ